ncbi:cell wall hydrolase [Fulvimarina sp. 2208YS6-2-32]|uniref:Cell wall hydrolase n=1 Tax=Fulvimarina uroteuthidis TaxID=3098149 RepID=A0ABU5I4W2_9HYPH|nr:cell wall hydrolase [Fulvimarina sp. 2208YS6-2-32]MDY8110419.1 cell wall hydrolase [Fulvimarina sp. 2208YS6-2-32]
MQDVSAIKGGTVEGSGWHAVLADAPVTAGTAFGIGLVASSSVGATVADPMRLAKEAIAQELALLSDSDRIETSGKSGRVFEESVRDVYLATVARSGSLADEPVMGSRVAGGTARIRTAFAKPTQTPDEAFRVAANFQLSGPPKFPDGGTTNDKLLLASLQPSQGLALGYASTEAGPDGGRAASLFEKVLKDQPEAFVPPIADDDHAWAAKTLPRSSFSAKEQECLANGIYFEARGEITEGQAAVAQVILNRVRNPSYPNTICGVVYQNQHWRNRCQFSFACDGIKDRISDRKSFVRAEKVAKDVTYGKTWLTAVGSSTHYHANYVNPRWASAMEKVDQIGKHIFYRTFNGGW